MTTISITIIACVFLICATYLIALAMRNLHTSTFEWKRMVIRLRHKLKEKDNIIDSYNKQWLDNLCQREERLEKVGDITFEYWKAKFEELTKKQQSDEHN